MALPRGRYCSFDVFFITSQYLIHLNLFKCVMPLIDKEKIPTAL